MSRKPLAAVLALLSAALVLGGNALLDAGWGSALRSITDRVCVLSTPCRQNRRYDFDTFGVSRADRLSYFWDLPSISAFSILLLAPPNSTSLPWCMMRSMMAEASLSSPNTTPHLLNSIFVVITRLRFS